MNKLFIVICFVSFLSCTKEEITSRPYPRIKTMDVTAIITGKATFNGEITFTSVDITEYGFVWTDLGFPSLENGNKISLGTKTGTGTFQSNVNIAKRNTNYSIRAYAKSKTTLVYGNLIEFKSK